MSDKIEGAAPLEEPTSTGYPGPREGDAPVELLTNAFFLAGVVANLPSRIPQGQRPSDNPAAAWLWDRAVHAVERHVNEWAPRTVRDKRASDLFGQMVLEARTEPDPAPDQHAAYPEGAARHEAYKSAAKFLTLVSHERIRQAQKGYTSGHDDMEGPTHLFHWANRYWVEGKIVEAAALAQAAVEALGRRWVASVEPARPYSEAVDIEHGAWETDDIEERAHDLLAVVARRREENR